LLKVVFILYTSHLHGHSLNFNQARETRYTSPANPLYPCPSDQHIIGVPVRLDDQCIFSLSDLVVGIFYDLIDDCAGVVLALCYHVVGVLHDSVEDEFFDVLTLSDLDLAREIIPLPLLGLLALRALNKVSVYLVVNTNEVSLLRAFHTSV
jgi:hypothetical protein